MRHALILAGGSGTRLWPIIRKKQPKQLIGFVEGRSLLEIAFDRLDGLIEKTNRYICGAEKHRTEILSRVDELPDLQYTGEPVGRDTLAALALSAAVICPKNRAQDVKNLYAQAVEKFGREYV